MKHTNTRLYPEDQQKVDQYLSQADKANARKPFRPIKLMCWLAAIIAFLGILSQLIGNYILH